MSASGGGGFESETLGVVQETKRCAPDDLGLLHKGMGVFSKGTSTVQGAERSDARLLQMGFISQSYNTLYSAIDLASKGLYFQAMGHMRFVFESWVTYWYLEKHPQEACRWLKSEPGCKPPKIETMRNKMDHPSKETKKKIGDHHSALHRFAHSDPIAVRYLFEDVEDELVVRLGVTFDSGRFEGCCYEILLRLGYMLDALSRWIPEEDVWHREYTEVTKATLEFMDRAEGRGVE